jgi:uncharacterized protein with PIN domain
MGKVETLLRKFNCSPRVLANLLAISEFEISDIHPRVEILYQLIKDDERAANELHGILNQHVFEDLEGKTDSVLSAIQQDKYELDTLKHIKKVAEQSASVKNDDKLATVINALLVYADHPTRDGSLHCRRLIGEASGLIENTSNQVFLDNAYQMVARPYMKAPDEIRELIKNFQSQLTCELCELCGHGAVSIADVQTGQLVNGETVNFKSRALVCPNCRGHYWNNELADVMLRKIETYRRLDFVAEFTNRFGHINGESLNRVASEDPKFLAEFISFGKIKQLTCAYALSALGIASDDAFLELIMAHTKSESPLVREGAYLGLAEYFFRDEKKYADLLPFFKHALEHETGEGVKEQILNLINTMEMYQE